MNDSLITTADACRRLGLSEPALRHHLRQVGSPRPRQHPTLRAFLWTNADIQAMAEFIGIQYEGPEPDAAQRGESS